MVDVYQTEGRTSQITQNPTEVHYWRPPCSCGVDLDTAVQASYPQVATPVKGDVHFWRPPCSCGVSLDDSLD